MPSNKDRLYVALYARGSGSKMPGKEDTYHWALLVGPKVEPESGDATPKLGMRFHAKNTTLQGQLGSEWRFEGRSSDLARTSFLLVRVLIAKIEKKDRLFELLKRVPVRGDTPGWNCVEWVKEALEMIGADGKALGSGVIEWKKVRDVAMSYCQQKKDQHRFDGTTDVDMKKVSTYDLIDGKEIIP